MELVVVGRKRKRRMYPDREPANDPAWRETANQPHRAWLPLDMRLSEKAATPLGGLNLIGVITDEQYEAGCRYADVVGKYRGSIETPREGHSAGKGYRCLGELNCEDCECRRRKNAYDAAFEALADAGQKAARVVSRVAIYEETCRDIESLRRGLSALERHFGLTDRKRYGSQ